MSGIANNLVLEKKESKSDNVCIHKAFDRLFKDLYVSLVFYTNRMIGGLEVSEDLVQETFVKYWAKFRNEKDHSFAKNYLYRSAHNAAIDYLRHQKVEEKRLNAYLTFQEDYITIDDLIAYEEINKGINRAKEALPDRCLEVFQLSRDEGLTYCQIAKKMRISIKTVETQMSKALRIFRRELAPL
ncbi:MAG: RNA polymerase sigma-70 factor [Bacteroidota bacterium]